MTGGSTGKRQKHIAIKKIKEFEIPGPMKRKLMKKEEPSSEP